MTLLVALKGADGLVLAADSRGTFGDPRGVTAQNDSLQKAHVLAGHVGLLQAGSGELGIQVLRDVQAVVASQQADGVTPVMGLVRDTVRARYQEWFPTLPPVQVGGLGTGRPDISFLIGGYDVDAQGAYTRPCIYQLVSGLDFPPMLHDYGFAVAGVPQYALYLLNRLYQPDRGIGELSALAVYTITETASQDGKVGGPVRVITVTPGEGCTELDGASVGAIVAANDRRAEALRSSFYGSAAGGAG